ncbi:MAG: hypothetical protein HY718_13395 [Planctomycetes bacterium]|nr:hypothetical protein [Planctomycetota bacterium]
MTEDLAHLEQGRSQLEVYEYLAGQPSATPGTPLGGFSQRPADNSGSAFENNIPEAHALHFLQMATENIAKAIFLRSGNTGWDKYTHRAFSAIPHHLRARHIAARLGWRDFDAYKRFLRDVRSLCREIEELHPQVGSIVEKANVEYPWPGRDSLGNEIWYVPAHYSFRLLSRMRKPLGVQLIRFLHLLANRFDTIF